jgi:C4-dicarboxylate transporter DctQ subunit
MNALWRAWDHFEEGFIALLLAAMTLVTFIYVILNNLYSVFYSLADQWPAASEMLFSVGDSLMGMAQAMTWSISLTKALFAWLIFFGQQTAATLFRHPRLPALFGLCRPARGSQF